MVTMLRSFLLFAVVLAVAACGYRPLYATDPAGSSVATDLSGIAIQETGTRIGQQLRNRLISTIRPAGQEGEDRYRLVLAPAISETQQGDQPLVDVSGKRGFKRMRLKLDTGYELYDIGTGKLVTSGKSFSFVGYDSLYEPVADRQAKANATERAVLEVATDIRNRLAAFMSRQRS